MKKEQYKAVWNFGNASQVLLLCFESVGSHTLKVSAEAEGTTNVGSKFKPLAPPQGRRPATNKIPSP